MRKHGWDVWDLQQPHTVNGLNREIEDQRHPVKLGIRNLNIMHPASKQLKWTIIASMSLKGIIDSKVHSCIWQQSSMGCLPVS